MTLTKWDADLIDGLDGGVDVDGDYLPLEGGTLTGELTVDANLILEGTITEGDCVLKKHSDGDIEKDDYSFPEKLYILSPSQGKMQHLTVDCSTRFILESDQIPQSQSDQDYFFEDGQSISLRLEVHDLDTILEDRYQFLHTWPEDIWWVNTKDGLAPDLNETGAITVNLWKAKGVLYGKLAGDFAKEPEYHPNAFDMSKLKWEYNSQQWRPCPEYGGEAYGPPESRIYGPDPNLPEEDNWPLFVHEPQPGHRGDPSYGITRRGGTTFTRTSRDGRHHFVGQTGSADNPGEYRTFTNSLPSDRVDLIKWEYDSADGPGDGSKEGGIAATPMEIPHRFHCGARDTRDPNGASGARDDTLGMMYRVQPKLLGTAVDMKLRVEKGSGIDFNPDGTKMFQSVNKYLDPSLADKYENVIGVHHLSKPWDVGSTDFLVKEELNDIIYCDEKYSELRALKPDLRVCGLTFRPDGMGFYFAYVESRGERGSMYFSHYFVQQDLEVPWELSSAKEEYKHTNMKDVKKYSDRRDLYDINSTPRDRLEKLEQMWHINGMTVSNNGKYIHAAFPHMDWDPHYYTYCEKPKQYKLTTPWDVSTTPNNYDWVGIGPVDPDWQYVPTEPIQNAVRPTETNGAFPGHFHGALTHGIHWNSSGTKCYVSFVPETNASKDGGVATNGDIDEPILNTCHYFNQKVWEIDYDL